MEQVAVIPAEPNAAGWKLPRFLPTTSMELKNHSASQVVAYKVKTTEPYRYQFHPTSGFIPPNSSAVVTITLQRTIVDVLVGEYKVIPDTEAREAFLQKEGASRDKFLVKYSFVEENEFGEEGWLTKTRAIKDEKVQVQEMNRLWQRAEEEEEFKESVKNTKIRVVFSTSTVERIIVAQFGIIFEDVIRKEKADKHEVDHYVPPPPSGTSLDQVLMKFMLGTPIAIFMVFGILYINKLLSDNNTQAALLFACLFYGFPLVLAWFTCGLGNAVKRKLGLKVPEVKSNTKVKPNSQSMLDAVKKANNK